MTVFNDHVNIINLLSTMNQGFFLDKCGKSTLLKKDLVVWDYAIVYIVETNDENDNEPHKEREGKDMCNLPCCK